jgi:hypothetical protein
MPPGGGGGGVMSSYINKLNMPQMHCGINSVREGALYTGNGYIRVKQCLSGVMVYFEVKHSKTSVCFACPG